MRLFAMFNKRNNSIADFGLMISVFQLAFPETIFIPFIENNLISL